MIGTPGFIGDRLSQAREARGLSAVSLAEMIGVQSTNISKYESGRQSPSPDVMDKIVLVLNQPPAFFRKPIRIHDEDKWWRAMSAAAKSARSRACARHEWLHEIVFYLKDYVDFPAYNVPDFNLPSDVQKITNSLIEDIAGECRRYWKLGTGPIADVVLLMENNGIIVSRGEVASDYLDAYSQHESDLGHPIVFLGSDKESAVRSRHDASHELGHLILHRNVDAKSIRNPILFKLIEEQAHRFAAAFNLPAEGFADQLWTPTLDAFLALKPHWKVAVAAMIMRCEQLGILSEDQTKRAWINMNRRGWRKKEPLDDRLVPERPRLLRRSFEMLVNEGIKMPEQILIDLSINASDVESLACLDPGYLSGEAPDVIAMPQLRDEVRLNLGVGQGNVIRFTAKKN